MIRRGGVCHAIAMLLVSVCLWCSTGTTAVALTVTPSPTEQGAITLTPTPTAEGTITATPTRTPTCAFTGTPYCSNQCVPCPTIRANCYTGGSCGLCIQNPSCGSNEVCVPDNHPYPPSGCCSCATVTPTPTFGGCDVCDGRSCEVGGNGGNCLVQPNGGCACVPEVTPSTPPSVTPTATPTPPTSTCIGDCGGDGEVTIDEIITMVGIALDGETVNDVLKCPGVDLWCNGGVLGVTIDCIIEAVNNALEGCPIPTPTPTPCAVGQCLSTLGYGCTGRSCESAGHSTCDPNEFCDLSGQQCPCVPPTPTLPHGHACCECENAACTDFAWAEVEPTCPLGCQTFMDAECEAPCHGGPLSGPAVCVPLTPCTTDADCDDGNGCTADRCTINGCSHDCVCV